MSIIEQLQQGCYGFGMPAQLALAGGEILLCVQVLQSSPGEHVVMRAQWQGRLVLVKLMLNTVSGRRRMRRELTGYRILKAAEITTPDLLFASRSGDEGHVLVFKFPEQAQCLGKLWHNRPDRRLDIAASSSSLIAQLHRKGCSYTKPHLDNFLLAGNQLYVIDFRSVKQHLNTEYGKWQRKNLALFLVQFPPLWRKTLLGFLAESYAEAAADRKLEKTVARAWRRRKSRHLKRCFRECSEFSTHKSWCLRAVWKRAHHSADLASFLQNPDTWVERGEVLRDGNLSTVVRTQMGEGQSVVIKRNNIWNMRHWRHCLGVTKGHINWRNAHLLKISGIATPEPIAFAEKRWGPFRLHGYYVCGFNTSPSVMEKYRAQHPTERELVWLEELLTGMRLARLYHGDLHPFNMLVTDKNIELIDLDSLKECPTEMKMNISLKKDRRRFLKNWKDKPELLKLFSEIFSKAEWAGNL